MHLDVCASKIGFTLAEVFSPHSADKRTNAFTLAEVLITLGIIGVVAALTLPTLIQNYKKRQVVVQLKKSYAELAQALELAEVEHGNMEHWTYTDLPADEGYTPFYFVKHYVMSHIKTSKACFRSDEIKNNCSFDLKYKYLNGGVYNLIYAADSIAMIITQSGYSILFAPGGPTIPGSTSIYKPHMHFYVDINGPLKGENQLGKDVFQMSANFGPQIANGGNEPAPKRSGYMMFGAGWIPSLTREELLNTNEYFACSTDKSIEYAGRFCGALIQMDGWEIPEDYPVKF